MGFATNSTIISALAVRGCLTFGTRLSVGMFKHNDMKSHGALLKEVTSQSKTHRPWKKIVLIVEGLYSTEGTSVNLPGSSSLPHFFKLRSKTSFVYHSSTSSSTKPTPLSMLEFPQYRSVDILMGTFTKSFGAAGRYVAGNKMPNDDLCVHTRRRLRRINDPFCADTDCPEYGQYHRCCHVAPPLNQIAHPYLLIQLSIY